MTLDLLVEQPSLPGLCPISEAVSRLSHHSGIDERGAVFTRREVVDFMLDLAGYEPTRDLVALRLLEPSFGGGEFIVAAVERLVASWKARGCQGDLDPCIHAVELHRDTYEATRVAVLGQLLRLDFTAEQAQRLVTTWLHLGDFLLAPLSRDFDVVVGNPPYVRQELIPGPLLTEYRKRFSTLYDRADLYVPFIERSLDVLADDGRMVFICADRWTKNKYGGPLRAKISQCFHLRAYVDMVDTPAFESEVIAYPAITLIERGGSGSTMVAEKPEINAQYLSGLGKALLGQATARTDVRAVAHVVNGFEPWLLGCGGKTSIIRRLEASLPTLEEVGCKVGIGVATGADKAFIGPFEALDVEPSRKIPLATTRDISRGHVEWLGLGVVNPFEDDGTLVDLAEYPKLAAYLGVRREVISRRYVAQKSPDRWYRTIDRITPALAATPKLLIPDIKGEAQVVFEAGHLYPHHNLYFVVSADWSLHALQAVLLSSLAHEFIRAYSTAMRGGFLRFQAQYLRRIRIPRWQDVSQDLRSQLSDAARRLDTDACDRAVAKLYELTEEEISLLNVEKKRKFHAPESL
jgi:hypothetical protein